MTSTRAPEGAVWVCRACGRTREDCADLGDGWDESCMLNSSLVRAGSLERGEDGRVARAEAFDAVAEFEDAPTIKRAPDAATLRAMRDAARNAS